MFSISLSWKRFVNSHIRADNSRVFHSRSCRTHWTRAFIHYLRINQGYSFSFLVDVVLRAAWSASQDWVAFVCSAACAGIKEGESCSTEKVMMALRGWCWKSMTFSHKVLFGHHHGAVVSAEVFEHKVGRCSYPSQLYWEKEREKEEGREEREGNPREKRVEWRRERAVMYASE